MMSFLALLLLQQQPVMKSAVDPDAVAPILALADGTDAHPAQPDSSRQLNVTQIIVPPANEDWPSFEGTLLPREEKLEVSARCPRGLIRLAVSPRARMGSRLLGIAIYGRDLPAESRTRIEYFLRLASIQSIQVAECGSAQDDRIRIRVTFDGSTGRYTDSFDIKGRDVVLREESGVDEFGRLHPPQPALQR